MCIRDRVVQELEGVAAMLKRSASRAVFPRVRRGHAEPVSEETRARIREHVKRGRFSYEAGDYAKALQEMRQALKLDPNCDEAAEILWRSEQKAVQEEEREARARIDGLLARVQGNVPSDAQQALAELALLAPDDPRVAELLRQKNRV